MRRGIGCALMSALALLNVGCIMILGVKNLPAHKHVVEVDGKLYVVDDQTYEIQQVDSELPERAETSAPTEVPSTGD